MPGNPRWAWGIPPLDAEVDCHGSRHRVSWRWGRLVLDDHHLGAEAVLEALGGEIAPCLDVLHAWRSAAGSEAATSSARRRAAGVPDGLAPALGHARLARRVRAWRGGRLGAGELRGLHRELLDGVRRALGVAVRTGSLAAGPRVSLGLLPIGPDGEPSVEVEVRAGRTRVDLAVAPSWLLDVGARGLGGVEGALVLEVLEIDRSATEAVATVLHLPAAGAGFHPSVEVQSLRRTGAGWERSGSVGDPIRRPGLWWRVRSVP